MAKWDYQSYGNGVLTDLAYDPRGFISDMVHWRGSTNLMQRNYHRDWRDRITSWQKGNNPSTNPRENGRGDRYLYDNEGQLTDAWYNAADPHDNFNSWERKDFFNYDAMGNRQGWNDIANRGHMLIQRRDNGLNQYHSWENNYPDPPQHWGSGTFYDDNFNANWQFPGNGVMMADGFIVASYNALNQPVGIGSMAYAGTGNYVWFGHDPLGRCVKRAVGPPDASGNAPPPNANPATYFYYDGWNLIQEGLSATNIQRVYVHGGRVDEIVHSKNYVTSQRAYHQYDARAHCTLLTGTSGQILEQYEYDAFGWPYFYQANGSPMTVNNNPNSVFGNRFLFTGREWLSDLRLYDYCNRIYQPELGRFLQPDPKQFEAGDYNLYRYCHNDPINKTDPTGLTFVVQEDQKKLWNEVKQYLRQDPAQRKIIDRLSKPDIKVRIDIFKGKVSGAVFDPKLAVRWNPNSAIKSVGSGTRLSPALVLGHELDHIYQGVLNQDSYRNDRNAGDSQYSNREERRVITGSEASMLRTFYNEGPRSDYNIQPYPVSGPFER